MTAGLPFLKYGLSGKLRIWNFKCPEFFYWSEACTIKTHVQMKHLVWQRQISHGEADFHECEVYSHVGSCLETISNIFHLIFISTMV